MPRSRDTGPPMTFGNMRANGVRGLDVTCACGHRAIVDCDAYPDELAVSALGHRLRCGACGRRPPLDMRPNWQERGEIGFSGRPGPQPHGLARRTDEP